jgi:non-canonical purine NTP pyrophosphatase (RdgB/HAM1 family)
MARRCEGGRLVVASHNPGKVREIGDLLRPCGFETLSVSDLGLPEPEETGATFLANAELKARAAALASSLPALADDSGLVVPALGGAPGIYSARWAGPGKDFRMAMERVQRELGGSADRRAYFICALALAWPDGHVESFEGRVDGTLVWPPRGTRGFGYDPMFLPEGGDLTFGEMEPQAKHKISHRARAFAQLTLACFDAPMALIKARTLVRPAPEPGFGLYVHWPFCQSKCPYCDFNSHVRSALDEPRWRRALLVELDHFADRTSPRPLTSLFFGGGTPSLMDPGTVGAVIGRAAERWGFAPGAEITLEANPGSADGGRFAGYRAAGVNRLSLGVQALNDSDLRFLGRRHSAAEALEAIGLARRLFPRHSFDLIYARPGQAMESWKAELRQALGMAGDHLSLYQLTIEAETPFGAAFRRGELKPMPEEEAARLYETTQEIMASAGLPAYEISNHARPGGESRHNLTYWRYGDYVGIGPGAHGRLTLDGAKLAFRQHRAPEAWLALVEGQGHATRTEAPIAAAERFSEMAMMGLRLTEGLWLSRIEEETGAPLERWVDAGRLRRLAEGGFLELDDQRLAATPAGRQRLDAVLGALIS